MSNPPLSDIDYKNKIAWVLTTLESLQNEILFGGAREKKDNFKSQMTLFHECW